MTPTHQVGFLNGFGATIWSGTPESAVSLSPVGIPGFGSSDAYGVAGDQQVGRVIINNVDRPALWRGTAGSFVDLTPPGALGGRAYATDGARQWGNIGVTTSLGTRAHAGYWSGTAASFVDLNPPIEGMASGIRAIGGGQQAGVITYPNTPQLGRAATWQGTAESWRDLHPFPSFGQSYLYGTTGTAQVGWSNVPGFSSPQAGVWFGTPESFVRLSAFLPQGFGGESIATCIIEDSGRYIVGGFADGPNGQHHAFLWTRDVPAPGTVALLLPLALAARRRR